MEVINAGEEEFQYLRHPFFRRRMVDPYREQEHGILRI